MTGVAAILAAAVFALSEGTTAAEPIQLTSGSLTFDISESPFALFVLGQLQFFSARGTWSPGPCAPSCRPGDVVNPSMSVAFTDATTNRVLQGSFVVAGSTIQVPTGFGTGSAPFTFTGRYLCDPSVPDCVEFDLIGAGTVGMLFNGGFHDSTYRFQAMTPTPEPGSLMLLGTGLAVTLGGAIRHRFRRRSRRLPRDNGGAMRFRLMQALCALFLMVAGASSAVAEPVRIVTDGKLTGATGVSVGGTLYEVLFVDGTCVAIFSGCDADSDFEFRTLSSGRAAANAIIDQVLLDTDLGEFDTHPDLTNGCTNPSGCEILIPIGLDHGTAGDVDTIVAFNSALPGRGVTGGSSSVLQSSNTAAMSGVTWAKFSASPTSAVPEPGSLLLVGTGIACAARRLRRKPK
jgi:hypothetical protein